MTEKPRTLHAWLATSTELVEGHPQPPMAIAGLDPVRFSASALGCLLEASLDGIVIIDEQRHFAFANDAIADLLGVAREDLPGVDFLEFIAPDARPTMLRNFATTLGGQPGVRSSAIRRSDGAVRVIEYSTVILPLDETRYIVAIVRDVTETRRQEREAAALAKIAASLTVDQPMEATLDSIAEAVVEATPAVSCAVLLVSPDGASLSLVGTHALPEGSAEALEVVWPEAGGSATARAFRERKPQVSHDARRKNLSNPAYAPIHTMMREAEWDTIVAVPMIYRGRPLGMVNAYFLPEYEPLDPDISFLSAIADQAAIAVENARLYHDVQQKAVLEERQRLARELHDSVSQALYGIGLGARTARAMLDDDPIRSIEPIDYVLQLADAGLTEMRALIFELRPESLEREGIVKAIERLATSVQARHGISVRIDDCEEPEAPLEIKETIYRVAQEAINNIVKHARASEVQVTLDCDMTRVGVTIRDNGIGFDTSHAFPGHWGLRSMSERVNRLRGTFELQSVPGSGTTILVAIPLPTVVTT